MDYIIIDYLGIKEKILSSNTVISNVFSGPVQYDFNITINYCGLTFYKLKNYFFSCFNDNSNILSNRKIPYIYITFGKSRTYILNNVIISTLEEPINNDIKITLIAEHFNILSEDEIKEMEISLRKDKIKKILYKIKNDIKQ